MNFLGLLWVFSAISSLWSPQNTPQFLDHFSRSGRGRTAFLANQVVARPRQRANFLTYVTASPSQDAKTSPAAASRLWSPALTSFIESKPAASGNQTIANLAIQPINTDASLALSPGEFPFSLPQLMGNLFRRSGNIRQAFRLTTPLVTVVSAPNPCAVSAGFELETGNNWTHKSSHGIRTLELGECTGLWRNDLSLPMPIDRVFQVRVKGQVVAEVPTQADAERIARQLHQTLRQPGFAPDSLSPAIVAGTPMVKAGDTALFGLVPEWAKLLDRNPELLAIDWLNHLRLALDTPALSVAEAQSQMHGLVPTTRRIQGTASWYGPDFHGRLTATGEIFDQHELTAAHPSLPFNTYLKVTNLSTKQTVIVRINDRGPYFADRSLDLSQEAARSLGSELKGVVSYEAVIMEKAELAQLQPTWAAAQAVKPQQNWAKQLLARR